MAWEGRLVRPAYVPGKDKLVCFGYQGDAGDLYSAVAHTPNGDIPGKARYPDLCWYSLNGKEHKTNAFSFVLRGQGNLMLVRSNHQPEHALVLGFEGNSLKTSLAIADTQWGKVPGKAAVIGVSTQGTCWYPYGGKEYKTNHFSWVCEEFPKGGYSSYQY